MEEKIFYNLTRQKTDNYKAKQPEALTTAIETKNGKVMVADFEVFHPDYPYKCGVIFYDYQSPHANVPDMPFVVSNGELWAVKGFIQVSDNVVNIHCQYCGLAENAPITKTG